MGYLNDAKSYTTTWIEGPLRKNHRHHGKRFGDYLVVFWAPINFYGEHLLRSPQLLGLVILHFLGTCLTLTTFQQEQNLSLSRIASWSRRVSISAHILNKWLDMPFSPKA